MEILSSIVIGAIAGGLAALVCRSVRACLSTSVAVGILGGLLGLASDFWLGAGDHAQLAFSETLASSVGALLALFLWLVAQRLFLGNPSEKIISE